MKVFKTLFYATCALCIISCQSRFPMEKRYWTAEDYRNIIFEIHYKTPAGESYPKFSDPETSPVIKKLLDPENYRVVLEDPELGLNHRAEVSEKFFEEMKNLADTYEGMDVQDKFVYGAEFAEIEKFTLGLQIVYFKLGNDRILENASNVNDVKSTIRSNENTIVKNYLIYLDLMAKEKYFGDHADLLAEGITEHFNKLVDTFPEANFAPILNKAKEVVPKVSSAPNKSALEALIKRLEDKTAETQTVAAN